MPLSRHDLFGVDPNEFVTRRDELARELRAGGDKAAAAEIKQLRRPAIPVWALNRVAGDRPELVRQFVDIAEEARTAQRALLEGGDADDFRAILARRRAASAAVADAAATVIDDSGRSRDTYARDVDDGLYLVAASSDLAEELGRAELAALPSGTNDDTDVFAGFENVAVATTPARTRSSGAAEQGSPKPVSAGDLPPKAPPARLVKARDELARHREELERAERELHDAGDAMTDAEAQVARARAALDAAEARHDAAVREHDHLRRRVEHDEEVVAKYES